MLIVDRGRRLLGELERWKRSSGSIEAAEQIRQLISRREAISSDIDNKRLQVHMLKQKISYRKKILADIINTLTRELLSEEAFGNFEFQDRMKAVLSNCRFAAEKLIGVLEVLLGDLVCLLDSVNPGSAFPGLLVHDCPREADMSSGLYENFLLLVQKVEQEFFGGKAPFQYIITTTTPPPASIQCMPYLRLTLDPALMKVCCFGGVSMHQRKTNIFKGYRKNYERCKSNLSLTASDESCYYLPCFRSRMAAGQSKKM